MNGQPPDASTPPGPTHDSVHDRPAAPQTFPKTHHLRRPAEFKAVYDAKQRAGDGVLLVFARANGRPHCRIGLSVSRKNGNAVRRARIKRLLRDAYRLQRTDLPGGLDLVLIPRPSSTHTLRAFRKSLRKLTEKLAHRVQSLDAI